MERIVYKIGDEIIEIITEYSTAILASENNIWRDTNGDTSVKYLLTVGKKIS
ncbi:MAG: hypothetical protein J6S67_21455 [Methanobrevibacter sp.]|nr:hypothetical protein [Methanobrevibacter sp.]